MKNSPLHAGCFKYNQGFRGAPSNFKDNNVSSSLACVKRCHSMGPSKCAVAAFVPRQR